jgi:hypothetical protein
MSDEGHRDVDLPSGHHASKVGTESASEAPGGG